ncbi:Uncharacterized protein DBV15_08538 [Temnothorax longispinosus]|uniref:Uncharacterized protein n=1 Tax=Temnothorax longispinosus TaxID=300112 RepID=A0A4S2KUQ9_9HYME|nr:Uncharacterized protein DBV15_08538 [Temnothorax longispinosus]
MQCRCSVVVQPTTRQCANAIDVLEEGGGWRCMRVDCMKRARELFLLLRRCRNVVVDEKWQRRDSQDGRDIVRAQDKTTRIVFNDRRLMRGHACSSATVLFGSFFFPLSFAQDLFLRGTLHGPCRAREAYREPGEIKGDSEI